MPLEPRLRALAGAVCASALSLSIAAAQTSVTTGHYDIERTGANIQETQLTPDTVRPGLFGKLASLPVSGCVFAQPLLAAGVLVGGVVRDLVYIATSTNRLYAFDANTYTPIFQTSFGTPPQATDFAIDGDYPDFPNCIAGEGDGTIGILGTPVLDLTSGAMFLAANTVDGPPGLKRYHHVLHRVSLSTGVDTAPPVDIAGSDEGVLFEPFYHLQRTALLLLNGRVYVAFASHQDASPYYGWVFSYDLDLRLAAIHNYSKDKCGAGIWQSGGGISSDGQSLYFTTGNLAGDDTTDADNSNSILKVDPVTLDVQAKTSFPTEATKWDQNFDLDLGSSRAIVIPNAGFVLAGSKYGDAFISDSASMKLATRFQIPTRHSDGFDWTGIYNGLAYWNATLYAWPGGGGFIWGDDPGFDFPKDTLKAFAIDPDSMAATLIASGTASGAVSGPAPSLGAGYQGANLVVSANGSDPATGIVWAIVPERNRKTIQPGSLHAYRATGFIDGQFEELWNSEDPNEPKFTFAKMTQPLLANGKVFLPTFSNKIIVYGQLSK